MEVIACAVNFSTHFNSLLAIGLNSKESISKFSIGNRFHVKLRMLSPENCKQSLQVKSWKAKVTAEKKKNSRLQLKFRDASS